MTQASSQPIALRRIHEAFVPWTSSHPAKLALIDDQRKISYGELGPIVEGVARRLQDAVQALEGFYNYQTDAPDHRGKPHRRDGSVRCEGSI